MCEIIGRKSEIAELTRRYHSGRAEFVAVYGRRRVGKTFLINELFHDNLVFHHTGLSPYDRQRKVTLKDQLQNFHYSLIRQGMDNASRPQSWLEAFFQLECFLETCDNGTRQVVFIDELPWMDTARSGFLTALEAFWNGWGSTRRNLMLIVCGSATSWMLDSLINNKGGLYGRLTCELKLSPFCLKECEDFYQSRGIRFSRPNVIQAYMIMGGIPYYMNLLNPTCSLAQNVDALFFAQRAKLGDEFERPCRSTFDHSEESMRIIRCLATRHAGYTRAELAQRTGLSPNGEFSKMLKALIGSDFVARYVPFGSSAREEHYRLSDPFCWFWLHFKESKLVKQTDYWQRHLHESELIAWRGLAFEEVCLLHVPQIKQALGIRSVASEESAFSTRGSGPDDGLQIDLLINRADDVVNLCEMKFCQTPFTVTKAYHQKLSQRIETMARHFPDRTFMLTYVGNAPLQQNEYADIFSAALTADDLFACP